jgi:hypothetical protein
LELGYSRHVITKLASSRRLHALHRGVYAVCQTALKVRGRWLAAVLAFGRQAVLSHRSAAALWNLTDLPAGAVDVTAPVSRSGRPGIRLHRARIDASDRNEHAGIPVTSVARTLFDLAAVVDRKRLLRAVESSERLGAFDLKALEEVCARNPRRPGSVVLELAARHHEPQDTRSPLEREFLELCRDAGLPVPAINVVVDGYVVDALWERQRLVVELDGFAFHGSRRAFEADRTRDAQLQLAGYQVVRVTARRLRDERAALIEQLRCFLRRSRR